MDGQSQWFTRSMRFVEVKDLFEADSAIFEAPVSSALFTVAQVDQDSCRNNYNNNYSITVPNNSLDITYPLAADIVR